MLARLVRSAALLLLGLYAGGIFFVAIAPSVARLPNEAFVQYWQALNRDYRVLPPFLVATLALLIAAAALSRRRGPVAVTASVISAMLFLASIMVTVTQMAPLNDAADQLAPESLPGDFARTVAQWSSLHLVRTVVGVAAFVSLVVAVDAASAPAREPKPEATAS